MTATPIVTIAETITEVLGLAVAQNPEMATRLRKAAHIIDRQAYRHIFPGGADGEYRVESETQDHLMYTVNVRTGTCACPASQHQPGPCKHVLAVRMWSAAAYLRTAKQMALDFGEPLADATPRYVAHLVAVA